MRHYGSAVSIDLYLDDRSLARLEALENTYIDKLRVGPARPRPGSKRRSIRSAIVRRALVALDRELAQLPGDPTSIQMERDALGAFKRQSA